MPYRRKDEFSAVFREKIWLDLAMAGRNDGSEGRTDYSSNVELSVVKPILTKIKTGTWKNTNRYMYLKVFFPRLRTLQK
jgi:hypothetical protein